MAAVRRSSPATAWRPLARALHPGAWWLWALGLAVAASRTTNPLILLLIIAVCCLVVMCRRANTPWAHAFRLYLYLGAFIVVMRVVFRILFSGDGPTVLFTLPTITLPPKSFGIELLGPVSAEALLSGLYDGIRLAAMVICVGAANALANPKRLLAAVPSALYEIGVVLIVTISLFPQIAESIVRVRRAVALRAGAGKGRGAIRRVLVPVLADALDRSLGLAAAMDSRGYGRRAAITPSARRTTSLLLLLGVAGLAVGAYGTMDGSTPRYLGLPMLILGIVAAATGLRLAGTRVHRSRYRPDPWRMAETLTAACGLVAGTTLYLTGRFNPELINPSLYPITWPTISPVVLLALLIAAAPALLTPRPPDPVRDSSDLDLLPDPGAVPSGSGAAA